MKMKKTYFSDSVSDLCQGIIDKADTYEKRIKYLEEENKKLKDEHYKDSEMQRMEAELKKAKEDLYRGFPISEKEQEKIRDMVMYETFINLLRNIKRNTIVRIINIMVGIFIGLQQCRISVKVLHQKRL